MTEGIDDVEHGQLRAAPRPSRSALVQGLLALVMVGALLPSVLGLLGRWGWLLDLCNHFRFQCVLVLLVTTAGLLLVRSWKLAVISLAGFLLNLLFVLPLYLGSPAETAPGRPLTVMHFNVNTSNTNQAGVLAEIKNHAPELLFVQEVNPGWLDALDTGLIAYERIAAEPRTDNFGIACYVRIDDDLSITEARAFDLTGGFAQVPVIEVSLTFQGQAIKALNIHPLPPISQEYARVRNAVLQAAGEWSAQQATPHFIVGDFNATPWSTAFRDLQSAGGLANSQVGFGPAPTWPAGLGSLGMIPIDHLLHSDAMITVQRLTGQANGSDHKPLIVTLGRRQVK